MFGIMAYARSTFIPHSEFIIPNQKSEDFLKICGLYYLWLQLCFGAGRTYFSKRGSDSTDKYSHWKIVVAVGTVMGLHATFELLTGTKFYPVDFIKYSPAIICYVSSMILGYVGLRYIMLSVSSPICNSSGAVACILCLVFLRQMPDALSMAGIDSCVRGC